MSKIWIDAIMLQAASPKPIITTYYMAKIEWAITCMKLICILLALRSSVTFCASSAICAEQEVSHGI